MPKVVLDDQLLFPSDYLAAFDLAGADLTLTIASISKQELVMRGGVKKVKPILTFKEHAKKVVLNVTNADSIALMYGWKAKEWVGQKVTFFPTTTKCGKDTVDCIRVREVKPAQLPPAMSAEDAQRLADYKLLLNPDTVNLDTLNGTILAEFKRLAKKDPIRGAAWTLTQEFAADFQCEFDKATSLFVQKPQE